MICKRCGKEIPDGSKFCQWCGSETLENVSTQCPKCGSTNIQFQTKTENLGCFQAFCISFGLALMGLGMFGVVGAFVGLIIGLILSLLLTALLPTPIKTHMVCQQCGYTSKPIKQKK